MANVRSRNYPYADLATALSMARAAYTKDGRNKMSRLALAKHLGNDSLSGPALSKLGLLRAYGLIDGSGDELRITDDGETALEAPEGSSERAEALRRLAQMPSLFQEIRKEFPTTPSEDNLRFWLIKRQIAGNGATKAAKAYLNTLRLVGELKGEYTQSSDQSEELQMESPASGQAAKPKFQIDQTTLAVPPPKGVRREVFTLDEGDVVLSFPENLSPTSFEDLRDHLELFLRKASRRAGGYYVESYDPKGTRAEKYWSVDDGAAAIALVKAITAEGKIARIRCPLDADPADLQELVKLGAQRF